MKTLTLLLAILLMTGCAMFSDPRDYLSQLPDTGFEKFLWNRNTGPSSATLSAENAIVTDGGIIIDRVELTENFAFGSIYLLIEGYWREVPDDKPVGVDTSGTGKVD